MAREQVCVSCEKAIAAKRADLDRESRWTRSVATVAFVEPVACFVFVALYANRIPAWVPLWGMVAMGSVLPFVLGTVALRNTPKPINERWLGASGSRLRLRLVGL
ncbi:MAG: hypothetical protein JST54_05640 [Deltaproteobacteria bacterium]|nr:hypothetical protein [Deltaproteobacteria bacterium]